MKKNILFIWLVLININIYAQQLPSNTHFFINPYVYNPSVVGVSGYNEIYFTHRQQWIGIEGAPATSGISIHLPTTGKLAYGINMNNDKRGLLTTSSALFSVGYTAQLGKEHYLRGGLSAGVGMNGIQLDKVENINDPALTNASSNSFFLDGNIGLNYQFRNLNLGLALPNIFQRNVISATSFNEVQIKRVDYFLLTASQKFTFGNGIVAFEPHVLYHVTEGLPNRIEALGVVYLKDVLWFGGSYKQNNGPSAFAGVKINKQIRFGYSYDMSSAQISGFGNSSHELMLSFRFGKNKKINLGKPVSASNKKENPSDISNTNNAVKAKDKVIEEELSAIPGSKVEPKPALNNISQQTKEQKVAQEESRNFLIPEESRTNNLKIEEKVKVQKREHPLELEKGHYVVVNAFRVFDNMMKYHEELSDKFAESGFGYSTSTMFYYSYVLRTTDINRARFERNKLRKTKGFENTWVLTIE